MVDVGGRRVGIMGYLTPETAELASTGKIVFGKEIDSLNAESRRLREQEGVDILIAVGHSGFEEDKAIAREVDGVDVVVGGHTNTLLWRGAETPLGNPPYGDYPTVVEQPGSGRKVLVLTTSGYGKYLGRLDVKFDPEGEMQSHSGNPVLLSQERREDPEVERLVSLYREQVNQKMNVEVGQSSVFIDGGRPRCRLEECPFGDLLTDAMAAEMDVEMAVINSGAIKGSFQAGTYVQIRSSHRRSYIHTQPMLDCFSIRVNYNGRRVRSHPVVQQRRCRQVNTLNIS